MSKKLLGDQGLASAELVCANRYTMYRQGDLVVALEADAQALGASYGGLKVAFEHTIHLVRLPYKAGASPRPVRQYRQILMLK